MKHLKLNLNPSPHEEFSIKLIVHNQDQRGSKSTKILEEENLFRGRRAFKNCVNIFYLIFSLFFHKSLHILCNTEEYALRDFPHQPVSPTVQQES